jgi:hypothetical protein
VYIDRFVVAAASEVEQVAKAILRKSSLVRAQAQERLSLAER